MQLPCYIKNPTKFIFITPMQNAVSIDNCIANCPEGANVTLNNDLIGDGSWTHRYFYGEFEDDRFKIRGGVVGDGFVEEKRAFRLGGLAAVFGGHGRALMPRAAACRRLRSYDRSYFLGRLDLAKRGE